jgi:hypothetical protein
MNEYSSRSHAIVTIHMEQRIKPQSLKEVSVLLKRIYALQTPVCCPQLVCATGMAPLELHSLLDCQS